MKINCKLLTGKVVKSRCCCTPCFALRTPEARHEITTEVHVKLASSKALRFACLNPPCQPQPQNTEWLRISRPTLCKAEGHSLSVRRSDNVAVVLLCLRAGFTNDALSRLLRSLLRLAKVGSLACRFLVGLPDIHGLLHQSEGLLLELEVLGRTKHKRKRGVLI